MLTDYMNYYTEYIENLKAPGLRTLSETKKSFVTFKILLQIFFSFLSRWHYSSHNESQWRTYKQTGVKYNDETA